MSDAPRPSLIRTADDLGYAPERDAAIFALARRGAITRASLLVNGASAASALRGAVAIGLDVGLHLNLTEGSPVLHDVPSLVAANGVMRGKWGFRQALASGHIFLDDVQREAVAQLERFVALHPSGVAPTTFDGHQHVHVLPAVSSVLACAFRGRMRATRFPEWAGEHIEPLAHLDAPRAAFYRDVSSDATAARAVYSAAGIIPLSDRFIGFSLSGADCTLERVHAVLARVGAGEAGGAVEWMSHPGFRTLPRPLFSTEPRGVDDADMARVEAGGAPFTLREERAAAWAAARDEGGCAGCAGAGPDGFACSWEREREVAVLLAVRGVSN